MHQGTNEEVAGGDEEYEKKNELQADDPLYTYKALK